MMLMANVFYNNDGNLNQKARKLLKKDQELVSVEKNAYNLFNFATMEFKEAGSTYVSYFVIVKSADPLKFFGGTGYDKNRVDSVISLLNTNYNRLAKIYKILNKDEKKYQVNDSKTFFWNLLETNYPKNYSNGSDKRWVATLLDKSVKQSVSYYLYHFIKKLDLSLKIEVHENYSMINFFEVIEDLASSEPDLYNEIMNNKKYYDEFFKAAIGRVMLEQNFTDANIRIRLERNFTEN